MEEQYKPDLISDDGDYVSELHKRLKESGAKPSEHPDVQKMAMSLIEKAISESILAKTVKLEGVPEVIVKFPETQKVAGEVEITKEVPTKVSNFPDIRKMFVDAIATLKFPDLQKITGHVKADVDFPETQKVAGHVSAEVSFPEVQKITGEVIAKLDLEKLSTLIGEAFEKASRSERPDKYTNVRLTNGRQFYDAMSQVIGKAGASSRTSALGVPPHDYISMLYPDSVTEQFFYKVGGANGSTVAVVTVGYTSAAKTTISYVQKV